MNRIHVTAVATIAAVAVLAGCSTQAKVTTVPAKPAVTPAASQHDVALKEAVTAYSDAFLSGKAEQAYALLSKRCVTRTPLEEFSYGVSQAKILFGNRLPIRTFVATVSGDMARATYTYDTSGINQTDQPWIRERGEWHYDAC